MRSTWSSTPRTARRGTRIDGFEIRTAAVSADIPCITTVAGAAAAIQGIEAMVRGNVGVASLQILQARLRAAVEKADAATAAAGTAAKAATAAAAVTVP